jgi:hypothetical protein
MTSKYGTSKYGLGPALLCLLLASCSSTSGASPSPVSTSSVSTSKIPTVETVAALSTQPCAAGRATQTRWTGLTSHKRLVGTFRLPLKPGAKYSGTPKLNPVATYTAAVSSSSSLTPARQAKIMHSLESTVDAGGLASVGESTEHVTLGGKFGIAATHARRTFVFYDGVRQVGGSWRSRSCATGPDGTGRFWTEWTRGTATSWTIEITGVINCALVPQKESLAIQASKLSC